MAKQKKPRAEKYEPKLLVKGSFIDVINASVKVDKVKEPTTKTIKKG